MSGLAESDTVTLGALALITLVIVIIGIAKNFAKGWKWIVGVFILAGMLYLLASANVLRIG